MKLLWLSLWLVSSTAGAVSPEVTVPRLDPLLDRLLFLAALWTIIGALVIVLRWMISHADTLHRIASDPGKQPTTPPASPHSPHPSASPPSLAAKEKAPPPP